MKDIIFSIKSNEKACEGVYRLELTAKETLPPVKPGQFLNLEVPDKSLILRRPFCIYDSGKNSVTTYYAVVGKGTDALSHAGKGQTLRAILPLGNGFDIESYKRIGLLGGGMGCAELYSVTAVKGKEFYAYLGFASRQRVLFTADFNKRVKKMTVCTDDGSYGVKGFPLEHLKKDLAQLDAVLVCGPLGMVRAAYNELKDSAVPVFVSMEQRMACGVGACLVCTCAVKDGVKVHNKRVCADGPVFPLKDLVL